jgi:hypothetical protein
MAEKVGILKKGGRKSPSPGEGDGLKEVKMRRGINPR